MSEYYYGKLGDTEWTLLADKPIVLWTKKEGFRAFDSISEAAALYDPGCLQPDDDMAYFWSDGHWNEVIFMLEKGGTSKVIEGFSPRRESSHEGKPQ